MPSLKPWHKVVDPRDDLRAGKPLDASEFAVHLDKVRDGSAPEDYRDPKRFFDRTLSHEESSGLWRGGDSPSFRNQDRNLLCLQSGHPVRRRQDPRTDAPLPSGYQREEGGIVDRREGAHGEGAGGQRPVGRRSHVCRDGIRLTNRARRQ